MSNQRTLAASLLLLAPSFGLWSCQSLGYQLRSPIVSIPKETIFGPGELTAAAIQSQVMSFTDTFNAAIAEQWNRVAAEARAQSAPGGFAAEGGGDRASRLRRAAVENKLATVSASLSIASSPNPTVALADMVTMVTLQRMVLESPAALELYGEETVASLIETFRAQEQEIWQIARQAMTPLQQQQLEALIAEWREEHPDSTYVANVRLEDFAKARQQPLLSTDSSSENLLSLFALDPLASLDPAQREVQKSRMLGERMFFYASRSPQVLKWHVESLYQGLLRAPEIQHVLLSLDKATDSMARVSAVAEQLPQQVAAERSAALDQFFQGVAEQRRATIDHFIAGLDEQREATLTDIDQAQDKVQGTLGDFRETADVTGETATSLTETIQAADAFAERFERSPDAPPKVEDPDEGVFDDYRAAVEQTGDAADRLTLLAQNIDRLLASSANGGADTPLSSAMSEVETSCREVVDHAFVRLLVLALVVPCSIALAAVLYRRATR